MVNLSYSKVPTLMDTSNDVPTPTPPSDAPSQVQSVTADNLTPLEQPVIPPDSSAYQPKKRRHDGAKSIASTVLLLLAAPLIALTLTAFIFQSYEVDGPSMETTLQNHDRLIVVKMARTWARLTGHAYVPHRGDVIIFIKHGLADANGVQDKQLIKRVIGLPGERVVVSGGILTVFNKQNPEGFQPDKTYSYGSVITTTPGDVDITLAKNEIFVCGDNRPNSLDSRSIAVGPVPVKDIVGKLSIRLLPFSQAQKF